MSTDTNLFVRALIQSPSFSETASAFWNGKSVSAEGIVGGSCALTAAALFQKGIQQGKRVMILVTPNENIAEQITEDITLFLMPESSEYPQKILFFPPMEQHDNHSESALIIAEESFGERINVLKQLVNHVEQRLIVIVSMPALLQPVPPPDLLNERTQTLMVNSKVDLEALRRYLIEGGFHATSAIDLPGEFAIRGYILDIFAPDWEHPVRIEFFNDEIESIRRFDLTTQRSLKKMDEIDLTRLQPYECTGASLLDYFPLSTPIVLIEPEAMQEQQKNAVRV